MKDFDRNIEQLMNEHEVAPPFGMWNRIAAELESGAAPIPVSVNSPIPQRMVIGFIAGAIFIGASLVTAYIINNNPKQVTPTVSVAPAIQQPNSATALNAAPVAIIQQEIKLVTRVSKPKSLAKPVEESVVTEVSSANQVLVSSSEVSIPTQTVAENNTVIEPYYFPAVDNTNENKINEKTVAPITKVIAKNTDDNDKESISNNEAPKIKFRPRKHRSFSYGKIISGNRKRR